MSIPENIYWILHTAKFIHRFKIHLVFTPSDPCPEWLTSIKLAVRRAFDIWHAEWTTLPPSRAHASCVYILKAWAKRNCNARRDGGSQVFKWPSSWANKTRIRSPWVRPFGDIYVLRLASHLSRIMHKTLNGKKRSAFWAQSRRLNITKMYTMSMFNQ